MKTIQDYIAYVQLREGGLANGKNDKSSKNMCPTPLNGKYYHTNRGITYSTWVLVFGKYKNKRFLEMSDADWERVFYERFYNVIFHEELPNSILFWALEWGFMSGAKVAAKHLQLCINKSTTNLPGKLLKPDGVIGDLTIGRMKLIPEEQLFDALIQYRSDYFHFISDPENGKTDEERLQYFKNKGYLNGWLNRLNKFNKLFGPNH